MATPINTFRTVTWNLTTTSEQVYTTPAITSSIILMAQVSNIADESANVTAIHYDPTTSTSTELIKNFTVPPADAVGVLVGKLVLTAGQSFYANASVNDHLKLTLSLLESR
jgi:hypothetical protein